MTPQSPTGALVVGDTAAPVDHLTAYFRRKRPDGCPHGYAVAQVSLCPDCTPVAPAVLTDEREVFLAACRQVTRPDGTIHANDLRPILRGRIFHKRIGQLYRELAPRDGRGPLVRLGSEDSTDTTGRNTHHGSAVLRWATAMAVAA